MSDQPASTDAPETIAARPAPSRLPAWPLKLCGALAVLLSVYAFGAGVWIFGVTARFRLYARPAPGKIVALTMREELNEGSLYTLAFSFTDAAGAAHTVKVTEEAAAAPDYGPGDPVTVYYDVRDPARARLASFRDSWLAPLLCLAAGALALAFGRVARRISKEFTQAAD